MGLKGCDGTPPGGDGMCWLVFCRGEELMVACFTEREREAMWLEIGRGVGIWNLNFQAKMGIILQTLKRGCSTGCCLNDFVLRLSILNGL